MRALAEQIERQQKVQAATQRAFLAQGEFEEVRARFAESLQELDALGESQPWMRNTFGLTPADLRSLLALDRTDDNDDSSDDDREDQPEDAPVGDEGHWTDAQHSEQHE